MYNALKTRTSIEPSYNIAGEQFTESSVEEFNRLPCSHSMNVNINGALQYSYLSMNAHYFQQWKMMIN